MWAPASGLSQKLPKIKALAGTAVVAPEPDHGMCLGQMPPHVPVSAQAGPHLTLLISRWSDTSRACRAVANPQGQSILNLQKHLERMASQTLSTYLQDPD